MKFKRCTVWQTRILSNAFRSNKNAKGKVECNGFRSCLPTSTLKVVLSSPSVFSPTESITNQGSAWLYRVFKTMWRRVSYPNVFSSLLSLPEKIKMSLRKQTPSDFLKQIIGRPVVVKLNSGVDYRGKFSICLSQ